MDSKLLPKLPVISLVCRHGDMKPGTRLWSLACNDVRKALEEYGCFVALYEKVPSQLRDSVFLSAEEVFNLPMETKAKNTNDKPFLGYFGLSETPLHEGTAIADATTLESIQRFSMLMWPSGNDNFCEIILDYANLLSDLGEIVSRMIFESYHVDQKQIEAHLASTTQVLGFNKYRVPGHHETKIGAQPHTDKSFITILAENQVNGLEVKTKDGHSIDVDYSQPTSFVVMGGDALLAWSNGRVQPAFHRVLMKENKTRYSVGLFLYHKGIVEVPEEVIDEEHPRCFKPFDHFGILSFFDKEIKEGRISGCTMQAYCGV